MKITADIDHGAWLVRVRGDLDEAAAAEFASALARLARPGTHDVIADLRWADSIDPATLRSLAMAGRRAQTAGVGFAAIVRADLRHEAEAVGIAVAATDREAIATAAQSSHRRRGRTALTLEQVVAAA